MRSKKYLAHPEWARQNVAMSLLVARERTLQRPPQNSVYFKAPTRARALSTVVVVPAKSYAQSDWHNKQKASVAKLHLFHRRRRRFNRHIGSGHRGCNGCKGQ